MSASNMRSPEPGNTASSNKAPWTPNTAAALHTEGEPELASVQIILRGVKHEILAAPTDDIKALAQKFVNQHNLKADILPRIESELFKAVLDVSNAKAQHLSDEISRLVLLAAEREIFEQRAMDAEAHIDVLENTLDKIQRAVPQLESVIKAQRSELKNSCDNLAIEAIRKLQLVEASDADGKSEAIVVELAIRDSKIADLEDQLAKKSQALEAARLDMQTKRGLDDMGSEAVNGQVASLRARVNELERELTEVMNANMALQARNEALYSEIDDANARIATLSTKFISAEAAEQSAELVKMLTKDNQALSETLSEVTKERDILRVELNSHRSQVDIVIDELASMRADPKAIDALAVLVSPAKAKAPGSKASSTPSKASAPSTPAPQTPAPASANLASAEPRTKGDNDFVAVSFPVSANFDRRKLTIDTSLRRSQSSSSELHDSIHRSNSDGSPRKPLNARKYSKYVSKLSPVVEDRVLRVIFDKYTSESKGLLRSSRFLRFAKEYKIGARDAGAPAAPDPIYGDSALLRISTGDVDLIFTIALKMNFDATDKSSKGKGAKTVRAVRPSPRPGNESNALTYAQFVYAVRLCAERMYTAVIEEQTGTIIDCLPPSQREVASQTAFEVVMVKNIVPIAEEQGIMPWPLYFFDQTVTVVHFNARVASVLADRAQWLSDMYSTCCCQEPSVVASPESVKKAGGGPSLSSRNYVFVGVNYKELSMLFHQLSIVPQEMREHELYKLFEEALLWSVKDIQLLLQALPESIQRVKYVAGELLARAEDESAVVRKKPTNNTQQLGFIGFVLMFATAATQIFYQDELPNRLERLLHIAVTGSKN